MSPRLMHALFAASVPAVSLVIAAAATGQQAAPTTKSGKARGRVLSNTIRPVEKKLKMMPPAVASTKDIFGACVRR